MDQEIRRAIKAKSSPFNGKTLYVSENIAVAEVMRLLESIVEFLSEKYPDIELLTNKDWFERDDYPGCAKSVYWDEIKSELKDLENFDKSITRQYLVKNSIYSDNGLFLIRYGVPVEEFKSGNFDLTVNADICSDLEGVLEKSGIKFELCNPAEFFKKVEGDQSWV
jgi:hypothetical protein